MSGEVESASGEKPHVGFFALYNVFFWIGLFSFGGGLLAWIQREVVVKRGWMRDEDFLPGVALAQVLPGVNSTNMAVYVGRHLRGVAGAAVALTGMLTGPFLVMLAAAAGVAAGAIGMLLRMGVSAMKTSARFGALSLGVMFAVFVAIGVMKWPLVWVVAVATPLSVLIAWPRGASSQTAGKEGGDA